MKGTKETKEKEVLTQNSSKKTAFLKSIKVKILLLIVCVVAATGLLNLCITVPAVKSNVKSVIQNYMNDHYLIPNQLQIHGNH